MQYANVAKFEIASETPDADRKMQTQVATGLAELCWSWTRRPTGVTTALLLLQVDIVTLLLNEILLVD